MPRYFQIAEQIKASCVGCQPSWELFNTYIKPLHDQYDPIYEVMETVVIELKKLNVDFTGYYCTGRIVEASNYERWFRQDGHMKFTTSILVNDIPSLIYSFYHTPPMEEIMQQSIEQLQPLVLMNHFPLERIRDKAYKYYWAKAYLETKKWGFNTFAMRSKLNNDVLRYIRSYIQL